MTTKIAVIGGTGVYDMEGVEVREEHQVDTPFGAPSDAIVETELAGKTVFFLPRHGRGHRFTPSEVPYRANIYALKTLGVERVISISAVGSMRESIAPGHVVVVDQFFDRTKGRPWTFFEGGLVGHIAFADPLCGDLAAILYAAAQAAGATVHRGGTYVCMEGPQFSTRAESNIYRSWGVDVIGMTNLPEAKLAREAELCYATLAMATDYDCWHAEEADVTVDAVIQILQQNAALAQRIVTEAVQRIDGPGTTCGCPTALQYALLTDRARIPAEVKERLWPIVGRVLEEEA